MIRRFYSHQSVEPYVSVIFDKSISDPENITIKDNESVLDSILSQFRRCLCKKTAEGEVTICYLDDDNSNYYEDGFNAILTGGEGDVMVNFPEFYYKWVKVDDNKFAYRFALYDVDGDYKHVTRSLVGVYKGYMNKDKLYSHSNVKPTIAKSTNSFDGYATARGGGYQRIDFQQHCVIAFMLYAKYKNRNLQAVLGAGGAVSGLSVTKTGSSNANGIADSKKERSKYVCGLGIEGVFGGILEFTKGVIINNDVWTITDPDGSTRNVNACLEDGWITNVEAENGPFFDMVPTNIGGGPTMYYSDYYGHSGPSEHILSRSCQKYTDLCGVAYVDTDSTASDTGMGSGSRLAFRGIIHEIQDSSKFKLLPLL